MEFKFDIKDLARVGIVKIDHTLTPLDFDEDEKYGEQSFMFSIYYIIHKTFLQLTKKSRDGHR